MKQTNCTQINNQPKIQCLHRTTEGNNIAALHLVCEVGKDDVRYLSSICEVLWHWIYHKSSKETHIIACTSSVQVLHVKLGLVWEWWCVLNLLKKKKKEKKKKFLVQVVHVKFGLVGERWHMCWTLWLFPCLQGFWENIPPFIPLECFFFFFKVEISLCALFSLLKPGSVHSGSAR